MKREMPPLVQNILLGFASGVMVAASVWSLIIPSIEMGTGAAAVIPPAVGLLAGFAFLLLIDYITPHIPIRSVARKALKAAFPAPQNWLWPSLSTIFPKEWPLA
jgi:zinc transporter ZupT